MNRHTSGCIRLVSIDEQAALGRDRRVLAEQVLQHGHARARRVDRLRDLGELLGIAEQDHVARARAHRERVGERDLAGLVDQQVVERLVHLLAAEQPRGPGHEVVAAAGEVGDVLGVPDQPALGLVAVAPSSLYFFSPANGSPGGAYFSTSASRLWIAAWLPEATPTRWPCSIRCRIRWAPV